MGAAEDNADIAQQHKATVKMSSSRLAKNNEKDSLLLHLKRRRVKKGLIEKIDEERVEDLKNDNNYTVHHFHRHSMVGGTTRYNADSPPMAKKCSPSPDG